MVEVASSTGADHTDAAVDRVPAVPIGVAAAISMVLVWWATSPWGAGLSPDAIAYASIAESIRDHGHVGYWLEPQMSSWPPLYPLVLAAGSFVSGAAVIDVGRVLNVGVQGAIVVVVALLAWRTVRSVWLRGVAVAVVMLAQPLLYVATKVWSEPLFVLFVLLAALALSGVPGRRPRERLLAASALVIGAFLTRYAGFAFAAGAAGVLLAWPRPDPSRARVTRALWFGVPVAAAAVALMVWNRARTGEVFGPRWRPDEPFWHHAADAAAAIGQWFSLVDDTRGIVVVVGVVVLAAALGALVVCWRSREVDVGVVPVLAAFSVSYVGYMVWARTTSGFDPLSSRLMLPVLLPIVLVLLWLVERWAEAMAAGIGRRVVLALPALLLLPLVLDGIDTLRTSHDVGNEYTNAAVRDVVASAVVREIPDDCELYSNDPWLLWLADREAQLSPESDRELAIPISLTLDEFGQQVVSNDLCLVWFDTGSTVFFSPDELGQTVELTRVASDGFTTVYRVAPPT